MNKCRIKTDGKAPFIGKLMNLSQIKLFDIRQEDEGCTFSVYEKDVPAVEKILFERGKECVLSEKKEPFFKKAIKRAGLWIGLIAVMAVAVVFSRCVTRIAVGGNELVETETIVEVVKRELGVVPILKRAVDTERVKSAVCDIEEISDASVKVEGNTVFVTVLERLPTIKTPQGDVESKYDALVTKVVVYEGECKTKVGETVKAGDVLIKETDKSAKGDVYGRVWLHENVAIPFSEIALVRTGRKETVYCTGDKKPKYTGKFRLYEAEEEEIVLSTAVPVKARKVTYYEMEEKRREIDFEKQKEDILQTKFDRMERSLPVSCEKLKKWFFIKTVDKMYVLDLYYEIEMKISE